MIISEEVIIDLLNKIKNFLCYKSEKTSDDLLLADEINSANYYDTSYKIIDIFKHDYIDYHFQIDNKFYDIFVYHDEEIDQDRKLQMILCDNYVEIVKFSNGDYENRSMVTEFKLPQKIYSFYDKGVIIIEKSTKTSGINYKNI